MNRNVIILGIALVALVIQAVFVRPPYLFCDLSTLFVVYVALERAVLPGAVISLLIGYLTDVMTGADRGLFMFTLVVVFFGVRFLVSRFRGGRGWFVTTVCVLATGLTMILTVWTEQLIGPGRTTLSGFGLSAAPIMITGAALGYPLYRLLKSLDARFKEPEDEFVFKG